MKTLLTAGLAVAALALAAPAFAQDAHAGHAGHAAEASAAKLSAADSPIEAIAAAPDGKAALDKNLPGLTTHEAYDQFKGMSLKQVQPMSQGAITDEQIAAMRDPRLVPNTKLPRIEDAVKAGGFLAGTPADIIEALKKVEQRYPGLERVICTMPLGTHLADTLEQLDRFAKEVMPAFRPARAAAAAD